MALAVGQWGHRYPQRRLLLVATWLMCFTGLPLEHSPLAETAEGDSRTSIFARYTFIGALCAAFGALATGIPDLLVQSGLAKLEALRLMFVLYGVTGIAIFLLYRQLTDHHLHGKSTRPHRLDLRAASSYGSPPCSRSMLLPAGC